LLNIALNDAPLNLSPYSTRTILITVPCLDPNSGPATNHIFSWHGAFKVAFPMSQANMSKSFNAANMKAICTLKTLKYVMLAGRWFCHVSAGDKPSFLRQVHLHIEYHMTLYFLKSNILAFG
jgi:hypothetical protein